MHILQHLDRPLRWRNFCATRSPGETSLAGDGKICRTVSVLELAGTRESAPRGEWAKERERERERERGVDSLFTLEQWLTLYESGQTERGSIAATTALQRDIRLITKIKIPPCISRDNDNFGRSFIGGKWSFDTAQCLVKVFAQVFTNRRNSIDIVINVHSNFYEYDITRISFI